MSENMHINPEEKKPISKNTKKKNIIIVGQNTPMQQKTGTIKYSYAVGDTIKMKKQHPCGSFEWKVLRIGSDMKLQCVLCGHEVMMARRLVDKSTKQVKKED